jgi:hypothetical protein
VWDAKRQRALVSYGLIYAEPGEWNFRGVGQGIALWNAWDQQAERPVLGYCADHPTLLFCDGERGWDSFVADDDWLYAFACDHACHVARAPLETPLDRDTWQSWNGSEWGPLASAAPLFTGGLNMRVHYNTFAGAWIAIYSNSFSNTVSYRAAPALTGPWSDAATLFTAERADGTTYDAYVQPDFSEDGGRVLYVTFTRGTGTWFGSELALVRVRLE